MFFPIKTRIFTKIKRRMKDYIAELRHPDIQLTEDNNVLHYRSEDLSAFSDKLETLRQDFIARLSAQMNSKVLIAYLSELKPLVEWIKINQRKIDFPITNARLLQMNFDGLDDNERRREQQFLSERILDKYILRSAQNTIGFLEKLLSNETIIPDEKEKEEPVQTEKEQPGQPVISGTEGLAKRLGCSKSMAFSIIKEKVLIDAGIQYQVGKCWKFNGAKLDKYLAEHPDMLARIRCKPLKNG